MKHRLMLEFRGADHIHRWQGRCSCGRWGTVPLRLRRTIEHEYREHARASRQSTVRARRLTPKSKLPKELQ